MIHIVQKTTAGKNPPPHGRDKIEEVGESVNEGQRGGIMNYEL
jgi:hypothetical protein